MSSAAARPRVEELQKFALFRSVSPAALEDLLHVLQERTYPAGEVLFRRGDPGDSMFLVRSGKIAIFLGGDNGSDIVFRQYGSGQVVGEFALLDDKERSASARVDEELRAWVLSKADFLRLVNDRPIFGVELMRGLSERVRYTTDYLRRLNGAVELLINNDYERALAEMSASAGDDEIQSLITAFVGVVRSVQQRQRDFRAASARPRMELDTGD
jgi:CRP/FNR family transcriptional regulator, cyclic AMP receptor protein